MRGKIKRLKDAFGFITAEDQQDYFFYKDALQNSRFDEVKEGMSVDFTATQSTKGLRAEEIFVRAAMR